MMWVVRTLRVVLLSVIGVLVACASIGSAHAAGWLGPTYAGDRIATWCLMAAIVVPMACGVVLCAMRPSNRSGTIMFAVGASMGLWAWAQTTGGPTGWYAAFATVSLLRPLLFWLVLAWPFGRLRRSDRRWLLGWTALITVLSCSPLLLVKVPDADFDNPLALFELERLTNAFGALARNVVLPAGAVVLIVSVVRRHRQLPTSTRRRNRLTVVAGVLAGVGDLVLVVVERFLSDLAWDDNGRRLLGGAISILDIGRWAITPLLLFIAAVKAQRDAIGVARVVEIGPADVEVGASIAAALDDPTARVVYHNAGTWYGSDGEVVEVGGPGRALAVVERDGVPLAAVEHDAALDDRPTTVEIAVGAAASRLEYERLAAIAESQARAVLTARRAIVELEDTTRRRLERDLHDGAQQRIVGLALQTNLIARDEDPDLWQLVSGIIDARAELRAFAGGGLPPVLAEQGLGAAIRAMAEAAPVAIDVDVSLPASLPPAIAATGWFVVAEAVTNAVKHGKAQRVKVHGRVGETLSISVTDDGCGGASIDGGSGLRGLLDRATACGGTLMIDSPPGRGTTLELEIPVAP